MTNTKNNKEEFSPNEKTSPLNNQDLSSNETLLSGPTRSEQASSSSEINKPAEKPYAHPYRPDLLIPHE